jgi:hypothetical protein
MSLGLAGGAIVGNFVGSKFNSPIPVISSRTLGAGASMIVLFAGYKMLPEGAVKDIAKYATAGATVYTVGSLIGDVLVATKVQLPAIFGTALAVTTGAAPAAEQSASGSAVDLNTAMA